MRKFEQWEEDDVQFVPENMYADEYTDEEITKYLGTREITEDEADELMRKYM